MVDKPGLSLGVLNSYILIFLIFLPSMPIMAIEGLYQPVRLDFILMAFHAAIFLFEIILQKRIRKKVLFFLAVGIFYIFNSKSFLVGCVQLVGYISFFASFKVGLMIYKNGLNRSSFLSLFSFFIYFTLFIHVLGVLVYQ